MSVAFTKEESAETASETLLPERNIPDGPNLVTAAGLSALEEHLAAARTAYETAMSEPDVNERRRLAASPYRDMRYFAERVQTAIVVDRPTSNDVVAFGKIVTLQREDGRLQRFQIVGEDEADPRAGSVSFASPIGRVLLGREVGEIIAVGPGEFEIIEIS